MTQDPRLADLLLDWEEAAQHGRPVSAEELCRDCPELLDDLRRQIQALETIAPVLALPARSKSPDDVTASYHRPTRAASDQATRAEISPNPLLPGFEILGTLGRGGMGVVYKARQSGLERLVALKMVLAGQHASPQERARFDSEARLIARLNHPHIVQIYALGEYERTPYFVMEYMDGGNLEKALKGKALPPLQAAQVVEQLARAVHHAHQLGIIHRDLKPANVLLLASRVLPTGQIELDTPKICDFGLARHLEQARLTRPGCVVGTPVYMAPEQAVVDGSVGPGTDIYSLGVLLYELLTGQVPFAFGTDWLIMQAVVNQEPEPPRKHRGDIPPALEAICMRCLRKAPAERYPTAEALADDLRRFQEGKPVEAGLAGDRTGRRVPLLSRRRLLIGTAVAVPVATAVGLGLSRGWFGATPSGPPIKVGLLHPSSGAMALSGPATVESELVAIADINRQGGLLGRPIQAVIGDSDSTPEGMALEAARLIEKEQVVVLIGGWTSPDRKAILEVVRRHDHLLMYPVESEGLEESSHLVHLGALPNQLILPVVRYFIEEKRRQRFFLVGLDRIYAKAVQEILKDYFPTLDGELCDTALVPLEGADLKKTVANIVKARPDVILNLIQGAYNTEFFRRLREEGIGPRKVPTISFSLTEKELPTIDRKDMAGEYLAGSYFQSVDTEANQRYLNLLREFRNTAPVTTDSMEAGYVGVHLWAQAVRQAGSAQVSAVRKTLGGQSYDGPGGLARVEADNFCTTKYCRLGQVQADGQITVVWSTPEPLKPEPFPPTRTREEWKAFLQGCYRRWGNQWVNPGT